MEISITEGIQRDYYFSWRNNVTIYKIWCTIELHIDASYYQLGGVISQEKKTDTLFYMKLTGTKKIHHYQEGNNYYCGNYKGILYHGV